MALLLYSAGVVQLNWVKVFPLQKFSFFSLSLSLYSNDFLGQAALFVLAIVAVVVVVVSVSIAI